MADIIYTHRIAKLIEEFVLGAGLTVHLSDENTVAKLRPHIATIKQLADSLNVDMAEQTTAEATVISFRRR